MTVSLLTHGWVCYGRGRTIINRYVLPVNIQIKQLNTFVLQIINKIKVCLNINQITDKNINLKLTPKNINIKKASIINIGVNKCSKD